MKQVVSIGVKCPHCHTSLMDKENFVGDHEGIHLKIKIAGNSGNIWLCSRFECYKHKSDIEVPMGEIAELSCPHCGEELHYQKDCDTCKDTCDVCQAPMVSINLIEGGRVSFCSRSGCEKHLISIDNLSTAMNHFYRDYS